MVFSGEKKMSKSLEALERLYCAGRLDLPYVMSDKHKEDFATIEKELKAFEIIINKKVDTHWLFHIEELEDYNNVYDKELTQEEYDLLKEVLL